MALFSFFRAGRSRKRLSLDGVVPGVAYNRYRRGYRPASAPIAHPAQGGAPQDYLLVHPDAYEPHPGEAQFFEPSYSPYHGGLHCSDGPAPGLPTDPLDAGLDGFRVGQEFVDSPSPFVDHDGLLEEPMDTALSSPPDAPFSVGEVWDRVLNRPTYDSLLMADDELGRAMEEMHHQADAVGAGQAAGDAFAEDATCAGSCSPELPPDGTEHSDYRTTGGELSAYPEDWTGSMVDLPGDSAFALPPASLEQIVDEPAPLTPEPEMMVEEMEDPMLMDPWMMPGMGPMGPGFGSMM